MISTIATTNAKGQIVIPVAMRQKLAINPQTQISISLTGDKIEMKPIKDLENNLEQKFNMTDFLQTLRKLRGAGLWTDADMKEYKKYRQNEKKRAAKSRVW